MGKIEHIIEMAKRNPKRIVLAETEDERVKEAIEKIKREKIAHIVPPARQDIDRIVQSYYELRKHKGIDIDTARMTISEDPLYLAAMMVRLGMADGFVAGASRFTKDVIRAAMQCVGISHSAGIVFGAFLIEIKNSSCGADGLFVFADCAVIPLPSASQLVRIAASSGDFVKSLFGIEPRIAFLTYSSHGSAEGESIERALEAMSLLKKKRPDLAADGELQLDAAIIHEIQRRKAPASPLKGKANVLIFPSLDAGNITYKAVERLGGARAVGPALLGLNKSCSDLSRGCNADDIVNATALTVVRAQLGL